MEEGMGEVKIDIPPQVMMGVFIRVMVSDNRGLVVFGEFKSRTILCQNSCLQFSS